MSGKVKLKHKKKPMTYSEEADETSIKVLQHVDDDQSPIIEEIYDDDDSGPEDTMFDVDEGDEFSDILPEDGDTVDFVNIKLAKKTKVKPYKVEHLDEEDISLELPIRKKKQYATEYGEDSLTIKKPKKKPRQTFMEEEASLSITKEYEMESIDEDNVMYSICTYIADNDDALNLVEGERVYVIERHNSDWWFVRKHLTLEKGWVPSQYLMDEVSYTHYVQRKLNEKIDKLPVFEKPGPDDKTTAPKFIEKLKPQSTPEGFTVQFECKVEGLPRPQITWFRQTAIIKPSEDFQMYYDDDNVAMLIIREVFLEDAGTFTCVAKNAAGFASSTTELVVESQFSDNASDITTMSRRSMSRESSVADILEGIPPTFSRKPKTQYVDEGSNVILECRLVAIPEPDITWTFNNKKLKAEKNVKIVTESDMHMYCSVVSITNVRKDQEGKYEVIATNREGEAKLPIILRVRTSDKESPTILEPLKSSVIREGDSIVLSTHIIGNPTPNITWLKDGKPLKGSRDVEKDVYTFTIITSTTNDSGEYTAKAQNSMGTAQTSATLQVDAFEADSGYPEPPMFLERFEEKVVKQKGKITLAARVIGNPVPEISWLKNNRPLHPSDRVVQSYDGEHIELVIEKADSEIDTGDYKCIASNSFGRASHGARITVDVADVDFSKQLKKTIVIEESQQLILECETSHTIATTWWHNNKELTGMDHRQIVQNGRTHKLIIKTTNIKDSGEYRCSVKNKKTQSTVQVLQRNPEFIKRLDDVEIKENETGVLEVEITSESAEVIWIKDDQVITKETHPRAEFISEGHVRKLILRSASVHDEGEYKCALGDQECTAEVNIIESAPEIVTPLKDITCTTGEKAVFEIELTKGDALVKWYKDDDEIEFNDQITLSIDGKKQRLVVTNVDVLDGGRYACEVGGSLCQAQLTVEEPLVDFTLKLPEVTLVTRNTDAVLTVELSNPNISVTWFKKSKIVKPNSKFEIFAEGTVRKLIIRDANDDDVSEYSCIAQNVKTTTKLIVEDIPTPPSITLPEKIAKRLPGEDASFRVKIAGTPKPEVEWFVNGKLIVPNNRSTFAADDEYATFTIRKVVDDDDNTYTIKVHNDYGEVEDTVSLVIMKPPSTPSKPEPADIASDSLTIYWKPPSDDGQSEITEYIVEYKDRNNNSWTRVPGVTETTYKFTKPVPDTDYTFRVSAVNKAGQGKPSDESDYLHLRKEVVQEAPIIQQELTDITITRKVTLTLSCIIGGFPEPEVEWFKDNVRLEKLSTYSNREAKLVIENTTEHHSGSYKCVAKNVCGSAETSCTVTVQETPNITVEERYVSQKLRIDGEYEVVATVSGYPSPKVVWFKSMTKLEAKSNTKMTYEEASATLRISKLKRTHTGKYVIEASNEHGVAKRELVLTIIDKPTPPEGPLKVTTLKKDTVSIEWNPPRDCGGLELSQYVIEKCDLNQKTWIKVMAVSKDTLKQTINKLTPNAQYQFRVTACNAIGDSEPLQSDTVTMRLETERPSPPRGPIEASGMTVDNFVLSWEKSESDGGSAITNYFVEIKKSTESQWQTYGSTNSQTTHLLIKDLSMRTGYDVRIYARNAVGDSTYLQSEEPIVTGRQPTAPSPPQNLTVVSVTSRSVTLEWMPPASNGGSEVTGFIIEKKQSTSTKFSKVVTLDSNCLQYTLDNLREKSEYTFAVFAENVVGVSPPATTDSVVLNANATVPSPPTGPLEIRVTSNNTTVIEWGIPESDGGAPLEGYNIAIRDLKRTMWMEVGRVTANTQKFHIKDLIDDHEYLIRVFARNEIGMSEPLESDEPYLALPIKGQQTENDEPKSQATDRSGFSTENTSSWLRDHNMSADIHSYARAKLLRKDEYFFRIFFKTNKPLKKKKSKKSKK